jgi:hypothetical protein
MAPSASSMPCSSGNSAGHAMVGRVSAGTSRRRAHGSTPRCPISREVCQRLQPSPALPPCRLQLVHNVFRRVVVREDTPPRRACMQCAYTLHPTALLTPQRYTPLRRRGLNGDPCEGRDASTPLPLTVCSLAACTGRASQRSSLAAEHRRKTTRVLTSTAAPCGQMWGWHSVDAAVHVSHWCRVSLWQLLLSRGAMFQGFDDI